MFTHFSEVLKDVLVDGNTRVINGVEFSANEPKSILSLWYRSVKCKASNIWRIVKKELQDHER